MPGLRPFVESRPGSPVPILTRLPGQVLPAAAVLATLILAATTLHAASDRPHIFGCGTANGGWTLLDPDGYTEAMYDSMARAGVTSTRVGASWANIEETRGVYDWSDLDEDVTHCLARGIAPYCLIVNTPAWASPTGEATHAYAPLPEYEPDFQAFCTALAARYAGQITYWEFWNEQNGFGWHTDGGFNRVDEYVPLLRLAYNALKAGDPECVVSIGGLDDPDIEDGDGFGWRGAGYMELFYAELARRGWENEEIFDAVADHPYHSREEIGDLRDKLRALHDVLDAHGDGHKPIWITEYGWTTKSADVSQQDQADLLNQYLSILREPEFSYVTMASSLAISDMQTGYEGWGLTDQNLRPKPAYYAFQSFPRGDAPQISHVEWHPRDLGTVEVTWKTPIPSTSQVEYGLSGGYGSTTALDHTLVTDHEVRITGLTPGGVYHFRARSMASGVPDGLSADFVLRCPDASVPNAGFELGLPSGIGRWWRTSGKSFCTDGGRLGVVRTETNAQAVITIGGWGGRYLDDAIYTFVAIDPGRAYIFNAWTRLETEAVAQNALQRRVGTDPTCGTDPDAPSVVWSTPLTDEDAWQLQSVSATAEAPIVTVFVRAETLVQENVWLSMFVDDAGFEPVLTIVRPDFDQDGDVDLVDFGHFQRCLTGAGVAVLDPDCFDCMLDEDADIDMDDYAIWYNCLSGPGIAPSPGCDN